MSINKNIAAKTSLIIAVIMTFTACETSIPADWREWSQTEEVIAFQYEEPLNSTGVYIMDVESGDEIFSKNATEKLNPASTVKMMTALVTLEEIGEGERLNELIEVPRVVFAKFDTDDPNTQGGSMAGLAVGQGNLTYLDALYGLMLPSGNDAANTLAYNVGDGSIHTFVRMMNKKAEEIGCVNTSFSNSHGLLEEDNWSCAYDLALIARYAYNKFETFRQICGSMEYQMPGGYTVTTSNRLMRKNDGNPFYRDFVKGVKNGSLDYIYYTDDEGEWVQNDGIANLVSIGEIDNGDGNGTRLYIIATMEAPYNYGTSNSGENAYSDHVALYERLMGNNNDDDNDDSDNDNSE